MIAERTNPRWSRQTVQVLHEIDQVLDTEQGRAPFEIYTAVLARVRKAIEFVDSHMLAQWCHAASEHADACPLGTE